jgi:hypothetical protein
MMQLSVILPTRDQRPALARSLASLAAQSTPPARILVLDQASADGTRDWLRTRWPAIDLLRLPRADLSPAAVLDSALEHIDSDAVAFLTPGDQWPSNGLATLAAALAARPEEPAVMLPCERLLHRTDRPPRREPAAAHEPPALSALACRTASLRMAARGEPTLAAELLARLGQPPSIVPGGPKARLAAPEPAGTALTPATWAMLLTAAHATLPQGRDALLVGLDAADRPAGLLDLLGHAMALTAAGRTVEAFTLAELEPKTIEEAAPAAPLIVTATAAFAPAEAALQLAFEDLLRRAGKRPVRLALRRLAPSSLVLAGRLIDAASAHSDLEIWVTDRVSRSYGSSILGRRVRLIPPGIAGLAPVLHGLGSRQPGLATTLPITTLTPIEARWRDLDGWHEGTDREAAARLGQVLARLAGAAPLLRTAALQEAWSLILPGWAALAACPDPFLAPSLDAALFAALSCRPCTVAPTIQGVEALFGTWQQALGPLGLSLGNPLREAA